MQNANSQSLGLRIAGALFGLIAVAHLFRLVMHQDIILAGYRFPLWSSVIAFLFFAGLAVWLFELARSKHNQ
ncbi:hypothetical protein [Pedosphaera parvula]|nr:hypothetical protein [Pedosphaera parvula]